jgi:hypothetical protein
MIMDGQLQFTGVAGIPGSTDSPTTGVQPSSNVVDMGDNVDWGIGDDPAPKFSVTVTAAFSGGTSLAIGVEGSVDNVSFVRMATGPTIVEANLTPGTHLLDVDLPRVAGAWTDRVGPSQALPRYLRLAYVSSGTHTSGSIFAGLVLNRHDQLSAQGFPVSVTIPN